MVVCDQPNALYGGHVFRMLWSDIIQGVLAMRKTLVCVYLPNFPGGGGGDKIANKSRGGDGPSEL